jgi:glutamine amidotransferase
MQVVIVDYGSGNLRSALKAFERAAREAGVAANITLSADADHVAKADRVVLPGVGAYADCRAGLDAIDGMNAALRHAVEDKARPFSRHLRWHAADVDPRIGKDGDRWLRLDPRRCG